MLIIVPIIISLLASVFSVLVSFWSLVIVFFAIDFAFAVSILAVIPIIILELSDKNWANCMMILSGIFFLAGISIPLFFLCKKYTKLMVYITKKSVILLKKCFVKKEDK